MINSVWGIALLALAPAPRYPGVQAHRSAHVAGEYARTATIDVAFIVAAIGLLQGRTWAIKLAIVLLVISVFYDGNSFAWGFSNGPPTPTVWIVSFLLMGLWDSLWIYLVCRGGTSADFNMNRGLVSRIVAAIVLGFAFAVVFEAFDRSRLAGIKAMTPQEYYDRAKQLASQPIAFHIAAFAIMSVMYVVCVEALAWVFRRGWRNS